MSEKAFTVTFFDKVLRSDLPVLKNGLLGHNSSWKQFLVYTRYIYYIVLCYYIVSLNASET